jgi:hypothetical protein
MQETLVTDRAVVLLCQVNPKKYLRSTDSSFFNAMLKSEIQILKRHERKMLKHLLVRGSIVFGYFARGQGDVSKKNIDH